MEAKDAAYNNFFSIFVGGPLLEYHFLGNLPEKLAFLASKLMDGPLLEHGSLIEFLQYVRNTEDSDETAQISRLF